MREQGARVVSSVPNDGSLHELTVTAHVPRAADRRSALVFWPIGAVGGLLGGLLGIGGGSAIAPLLLVVGSLRPAQVSGTTLAVVLVISAVGATAYAGLGHLNLALAWPIALGSVGGAVVGALSARHLSIRLMLGLFLLILPYFAVKEFWPGFAAPEIATSTISLVLLGAGAGFLSGLLGISGASLVVPSLVGFFLIDHIAAQGIAMTVALANSTAGAATHARGRNVDWRMVLLLAPPAFVAAIAGAFLSHSLSESVLRNLFGVFVVAIWAIMLTRWIRSFVGTRGKPDQLAEDDEDREAAHLRTSPSIGSAPSA